MVAGKICRIKGCTNVLTKTSGQICQSHRSRWFRHKSYDIAPDWPNLKNGQPCLTKTGYLRINVNGERILQHRHIMQEHLGRKLKREEVIHHIDGNKLNNAIENLLLTSQGQHISKYDAGSKCHIDWSEYNVPETTSNPICMVRGCDIKTRSRDLCDKHYQSYYHNVLSADS